VAGDQADTFGAQPVTNTGPVNKLDISGTPNNVDGTATHQGGNDWDVSITAGASGDRIAWNIDDQLKAGAAYTLRGTFEVDNPETEYFVRTSGVDALGNTEGLLEFLSPTANTPLTLNVPFIATEGTDFFGFQIRIDNAGVGAQTWKLRNIEVVPT
jgi:hypothetical protein